MIIFLQAMNLPNLITCFRIVASFVFLYYGLKAQWDVAFPVFFVAALSDMVDGAIARIFRQRTRLGAFLDPAADKLLMFFGFVTLTQGNYLPLGLTLLVIARDFLISLGLAVLWVKKIPIVFRPTYLSKFTTLFQIATVLSALLMTQELSGFHETFYVKILFEGMPVLLGVTTLLTFVTAVQYVRIGLGILHAKTKTRRQ